MIDRDEVRHVARLARLQLSDDEVEGMARELAGVLAQAAETLTWNGAMRGLARR